MIGVIDSGCGGLNVIRECLKFSKQDFVFLVDNKNCPYGDKQASEIKEITKQNIAFLTKHYDIDLIILACNTISSLLDYDFMLSTKVPILKTFPDVKSLKNNGLLFATKNTIENSKLVKYYLLNYPKIKKLHVKNLAKIIDDNIATNSTISQKKLKKTIKKAFFNGKTIKKSYKNINKIALGCTHFLYIKDDILELFDKKIDLFSCEKSVTKNYKYLIRKNKKNSSIKLILTKEDEQLKKAMQKMIDIILNEN